MRRINNNTVIIAALACICLQTISCVEESSDNTSTIDDSSLCEILSQDKIDEMELDCSYFKLCEIGARKCDGFNVLECQSVNQAARWVPIDICDNLCQDGECIASKEHEPICNVGKIECSGRNLMKCIEENGIARWNIIEECANSCEDGQCVDVCSNSCTDGSFRCDEKQLSKCELDANGCYEWKVQKTCTQYCYANTGKCAEDLPSCKLTNNSIARIIEWVDGDTLWVRPENNGTCNNFEYNSNYEKWVNIRFNIRIHGIDAPECSKSYNGRYMTCVKDTNYNDHNEHYGYESWQTAISLLPADAEIIITCDNPKADGSCPMDATGKRELAYLGYTKDNASYDYSTEAARHGMAFSNTKFTSSKRRQICTAQKEAQNANLGVWSTGGLSQMGSSKRHGLKNMEKLCKKSMQ